MTEPVEVKSTQTVEQDYLDQLELEQAEYDRKYPDTWSTL